MKKIILTLFICCGAAGFSPCMGQEARIYKAVVRDSVTQKGLPDVTVFANKDTVGIKSKANGSFQLRVKEGATLRFRKAGYVWRNITASDSVKYVDMVPSKRNLLHDQFDEIEVDGKLLPEKEWDDMNSDYISSLTVLTENNKTRLIIVTK